MAWLDLRLAKWVDKEILERGDSDADYEWLYNFVYFQESELAHTGTTSLPFYEILGEKPEASSPLQQASTSLVCLPLASFAPQIFCNSLGILLTDQIVKTRDFAEQIYSTAYPQT